MEVRVVKSFDEDEYRSGLEIYVDDNSVFSVYDGEPEDNSLRRNFNDCYNIVSLLRVAFTAGAEGKEFVIKED